jgi:hypothetical protein
MDPSAFAAVQYRNDAQAFQNFMVRPSSLKMDIVTLQLWAVLRWRFVCHGMAVPRSEEQRRIFALHRFGLVPKPARLRQSKPIRGRAARLDDSQSGER